MKQQIKAPKHIGGDTERRGGGGLGGLAQVALIVLSSGNKVRQRASMKGFDLTWMVV